METSVGFIIVQTLNSLSFSGLLFLVSVGLTIIWGIVRITNFAHGALYMAGAYAGFATARYTGSFWLALIVAPLVVGAIGVLMEVYGLRYLYDRVHYYQFLFTFGAAFIIEEVVKMVWGVQPRSIVIPQMLDGAIVLAGEYFPRYRIFLIIMAAMTALIFWVVLDRTKIGMYVKAAVENSEMTGALGINIARLRTLVFMVGSALAAFGGVLAAPLLSIFPEMGIRIIMDAFIVVIVGGLGSFFGTVLGSLMIGTTETFGNLYFPDLAMAVVYIVMALVLIFRPRGFIGRD